MQIVMAYYGVDCHHGDLIRRLSSPDRGTRVDSIIAEATEQGFQVVASYNTTLKTLNKYVDEGHPAIVLVQAWANRHMTLRDWREDTQDGHYVIVIGYYDNIIVFEDPGSIRRTWMTKREFLARWHDVEPKTGKRYDRFAMVLLGKAPVKKNDMQHMD